MENQVLVIAACSKRKLSYRAAAIDLYQGDIFKKTKKWVRLNGFNILILSAKYGLVEPNEILEPYDLKIKDKNQIKHLQEIVLPKLREHLNSHNYKAIFLIIGNNYYEVIQPFIEKNEFNIPVYKMKSKNGIFDFKKNMIELLNNNLEIFYQVSGPLRSLKELINIKKRFKTKQILL